MPFSSAMREQQVLGGDVGVAELLGVRVGAVEDPVQLAAEGRLGRPALLRGKPVDLALDGLGQRGTLRPAFWSSGCTTPSGWASRAASRWASLTTGLPRAAGELAGVAEGFLGLDGQSVGSDHRLPRYGCAVPERRGMSVSARAIMGDPAPPG